MKNYKFIFLLIGLLSTDQLRGQVNLVPNPSFEDTVFCPSGTNQLEASQNWKNFGNSPDYYNICTGFDNLGYPDNYGLGYQIAHSGHAMIGIGTYVTPGAGGPNYREFVGAQLLSSLTIGVKYYFSFYLNFSHTENVSIASDKLGLRLSTQLFDSCCPPPVDNFAHIYIDTIISDSISWVRISGSIISDSSYNYVSIGNFFEDSQTDTLNTSSFPAFSYYYIDDVCVTLDSSYNNTWTSIHQVNKSDVRIYPNPVSSTCIITSNENDSYDLYSSLGQLIRVIPIVKGENALDFSNLSSGIYLLKPQSYKQKSVTFIKL